MVITCVRCVRTTQGNIQCKWAAESGEVIVYIKGDPFDVELMWHTHSYAPNVAYSTEYAWLKLWFVMFN